MTTYIKKPCQHCPFRIDVKPFLHPERASELAYATQNRYNTFPCHKTTVSDEDEDGNSDRYWGEESKDCAGFLTLQAQNDDRCLPEGFEPSWELIYTEPSEMEWAYESEENWKEMQ
tara:strand:- start:2712 stop:3059 length:348 start_codon:yes stop_codon:yes gene_type:complete